MGDLKQGQFGRTGSTPSSRESENGVKAGAPVLDLGAFRTKKSLSADRKTSVSEAFSGMTSRTLSTDKMKTDGRQAFNDQSSELELAERIERIKGSIQRINQLMAELKGVSSDAQPQKS